ncbi:MAG: G-protein coupled receptor [Bacteroidia bacterium]|nr:G-protein coupled receptor [Bacteroidia bacterium]
MIGLFVCFIIVFIVATNQPCRTPTNLLTCNTAVITSIFLINNFIVSFYGYREDWARNQPLCSFRAYAFFVCCGVISLSYFLQAMSRIFVIVFYKYKYLNTYRIYWPMIVFSWIIPLFLAMVPLFFDGSYAFEKESRLCTINSRKIWSTAYILFSEFGIPFTTSIIIYLIIMFRTSSARRVAPATSNSTNSRIPNLKRELTVARNMMIILITYSIGGVPYMIFWLWLHSNSHSSPPDVLFSLGIELVVMSGALQMIIILQLNKQIKDIAVTYLRGRCGCANAIPNIPQRLVQVARF